MASGRPGVPGDHVIISVLPVSQSVPTAARANAGTAPGVPPDDAGLPVSSDQFAAGSASGGAQLTAYPGSGHGELDEMRSGPARRRDGPSSADSRSSADRLARSKVVSTTWPCQAARLVTWPVSVVRRVRHRGAPACPPPYEMGRRRPRDARPLAHAIGERRNGQHTHRTDQPRATLFSALRLRPPLPRKASRGNRHRKATATVGERSPSPHSRDRSSGRLSGRRACG
jgi:hypothetical protein